MLTVMLYGKPACGLCHEARALLQTLAETIPLQVVEIDIRQDEALYAAYFDRIPVILIGERRLEAPINESDLIEAARQAAEQTYL